MSHIEYTKLKLTKIHFALKQPSPKGKGTLQKALLGVQERHCKCIWRGKGGRECCCRCSANSTSPSSRAVRGRTWWNHCDTPGTVEDPISNLERRNIGSQAARSRSFASWIENSCVASNNEPLCGQIDNVNRNEPLETHWILVNRCLTTGTGPHTEWITVQEKGTQPARPKSQRT